MGRRRRPGGGRAVLGRLRLADRRRPALATTDGRARGVGVRSPVARAGIPGAASLSIPTESTNSAAWEIALRTLGFAPAELVDRIAAQFGLRVAKFEQADARALALLPERLARKYNVFPLREDERHLFIATADPTNIEVEHAIGFASGRRPVRQLQWTREAKGAPIYGVRGESR